MYQFNFMNKITITLCFLVGLTVTSWGQIKPRLDSITSISGGTGYNDSFTYDGNGNMLTDIISWDGAYDSKTEYIYNNFGNQLSATLYLHNGTSWDLNRKNDFTYDANQNEILDIKYSWNSASSSWKNANKYESIYDVNQHLISYIEYAWNTNTSMWYYSLKNDYIYDGNGNVISRIRSTYDVFSGVWSAVDKYLSYYNNNFLVLEEYYYSSNGSPWNLTHKYTEVHDVNGNTILENDSALNANNQWYLSFKANSTFDMYNNTQRRRAYNFNTQTSQFVQVGDDSLVYDNAYTRNNVIYPKWKEKQIGTGLQFITSSVKHKVNQLHGFNFQVNAWEDIFWHYSLTTPISVAKTTDISVFPNPTLGLLTVDMPINEAILELYDTQGKIVLTQSITKNEPISLQHLDKGLYAFRLKAKNTYYNGKIILE